MRNRHGTPTTTMIRISASDRPYVLRLETSIRPRVELMAASASSLRINTSRGARDVLLPIDFFVLYIKTTKATSKSPMLALLPVESRSCASYVLGTLVQEAICSLTNN
jgi:hypothetical protein